MSKGLGLPDKVVWLGVRDTVGLSGKCNSGICARSNFG